jgi:exonuclease V gamma subunit
MNHEIHETHENGVMDPELKDLLAEFVEKVALLRRDIQHKGELEKYAARFSRMEQKLLMLADRVESSDPELAKALRRAWTRPAMSLAYRNATHQKDE